MKKYVVVGTFFGIQLRIHYSWLIIFGLVAWTVITSYVPAYRNNLSTPATITAGLIVTVLFFASVIAHEYAHSLVANHRGLRIKRITLFVFGGASELQQEPDTAKTELLMTAAGPGMSLGLAGLFALVWLGARQLQLTAVEVVCQPLMVLNLVVGIFNLLPAFPLDGGRILRSLIWLVRKDFLVATHAASTAGVVFAYLLMGLGLLEGAVGYLIGGVWFILIGLFLLQSARMSYVQTLYETILGRRSVRDMMNAGVPAVAATTTLRQFLADYVLAKGEYECVVTDDGQSPVGVLQLAAVGEAPAEALEIPVSHYMIPLTQKLVMKPEDTAEKAFRTMQLNGLNLLPVVAAKRLMGVVQRRYLEDYVRLQPSHPPAALPR